MDHLQRQKSCQGREVSVHAGLTVVRCHDFYYSYYFTQESWDYIGSSRMVYDMDHGKFPSDPWKVTKKSNYSVISLLQAMKICPY